MRRGEDAPLRRGTLQNWRGGRTRSVARLLRPGRPDLAPLETPGPQEGSLVPRPNPRQGLVPPPLAHSPRAPPRRGLPPPSERSPPRPPHPARGLGAAGRRGSHVQAHALFLHLQRPGGKLPAGRAGSLGDRIRPGRRRRNHQNSRAIGEAKMPSKGKDKKKGKGKGKGKDKDKKK